MTSQMKSDMLMHFAKGNTMPNRHNAMSVLMTGIGNIQKALDTELYFKRCTAMIWRLRFLNRTGSACESRTRLADRQIML